VINVKGWAVNKSGIKNVQVIMDGKLIVGAQYNVYRPDVNAVMPGYPSGGNSGYISNISAPSTLGKHTITIKAIGSDGSTCSSNVNINVLPKATTAINQSINSLIGTSNKVVSYAEKFLGVHYVYGGTTPSGFDCSGFVQYVYAHNGAYQVQIPRTTYDQVKVGTPVSKSSLQPGDLVFFGIASSPYHVGMYIGSNQFIESPKTGFNVRISTLSTRTDFCGARRIIK
jgi:cell wall-associated NlpC family hydrolase